jgi:hypothetical protein
MLSTPAGGAVPVDGAALATPAVKITPSAAAEIRTDRATRFINAAETAPPEATTA